MLLRSYIFLFLLTAFGLKAQDNITPLTMDEKKEVVDSISAILDREYVFQEIGAQIKDHLQHNLYSGTYDKYQDPQEFAVVLTEDVRFINNDLHLRVTFQPEMIAERRNTVSEEDSLAFVDRQRRMGQMNNHGFKEVKILDGNIGYLNLTGFYHVDEYSGATAEAAMNFLSNADALIIDLRTNGGGSPSMIQLVSSYLFDSEPVHLNSFYYRPQEEISQTWTLPYVPGKRRPDIDVYVLTSSGTFSAAEEFSYNLKNLKRATLVGETTGGGAHPGGTRIATDRYTVWVPSGKAINPITKTNWEGTGIKPHVEVAADQALIKARILSIEKLLEKGDEDSKYRYQWALDGLKAQENPISIDAKTLQSYAGNYGPRSLTYRDGMLYYKRDNKPEYRLIPMTKDLFMIEEIPYFRIKILVDNNRVIALQGIYDNGRTDKNKRDETMIKP